MPRLAAFAFAMMVGLTASAHAAFNQPSSRIVEGSGGVPLVVHEWGNPDGIPVLMLHGFSFGSNAFKYQIGPITDELRIVAPDLRGHGLSAKPWQPEAYSGTQVWADDIAAVIEATGLDRPVILGWSFGGYVTLNYLRHCGADCASGVILAGSLAGLIDNPPPPDPAETGMPPMKGDARADNYHQLFEGAEWVARVMTFEPPPDPLLIQKQMTIVMMPPLVRRAMMGLSLDNRDLPPSLDLPILFVHGEKDGSVPSDYIKMAVDRLPNARHVEFKDAGHSTFEEFPDRFNDLLLDFAKETYGRSAGD